VALKAEVAAGLQKDAKLAAIVKIACL